MIRGEKVLLAHLMLNTSTYFLKLVNRPALVLLGSQIEFLRIIFGNND